MIRIRKTNVRRSSVWERPHRSYGIIAQAQYLADYKRLDTWQEKIVRAAPSAGDRVSWSGAGWYRPVLAKEVDERSRRTERSITFWVKQDGPHRPLARLRYFSGFDYHCSWKLWSLSGDGIIVTETHEYIMREARRKADEELTALLGVYWSKRQPLPPREVLIPSLAWVNEPEPETWPAWADKIAQ